MIYDSHNLVNLKMHLYHILNTKTDPLSQKAHSSYLFDRFET